MVFWSNVANGLGLIALPLAALAAPATLERLLLPITGPGAPLGGMPLPADYGAPWAKMASSALLYLGTVYVGLGLRGSREFAQYSVYSRVLVFPVVAAFCIARFNAPKALMLFPLLDVPCALWCRAELAATAGANDLADKDAAAPKKAARPARVARRDMKMVLVVNTDLKMKKGKIAAQTAHAAVGVLEGIPEDNADLLAWQQYGCAKVALRASAEEMHGAARAATAAGLPNYTVHDAGRTQIPAGSQTVCAIGPAAVEEIDKITGRDGTLPLKLL